MKKTRLVSAALAAALALSLLAVPLASAAGTSTYQGKT